MESAAATNCDIERRNDSLPSTSNAAANVALPHRAELGTATATTVYETPQTSASNATTTEASLASKQLAAGLLQIFEPPVDKVRVQLKELINKQNKIYVDLSAEKFKLDNAETAQLQEMMDDVKIYREKVLKIKKQMHQIHQRTQSLKKRAAHIEQYKQKELQRQLQKQQQEESLIGNK